MSRDRFASDIGFRISARRKQLGLTQEQAAEKADLTQQFFASVEIGSKNMRAESIVKVCKALDISADYLLMGKITDLDRSRLLHKVESLNEAEYLKFEEIALAILEYGKLMGKQD